MKKTFTLIAALCVAASAWAADIVLDLSKPAIPEALNFGNNEYINETYDETFEWFEFPPFLLKHIDGEGSSWGGYYWDGFTICKSADNSSQTDWISHQWSNIAGGGVQVTADGVTVDSNKPYVVGYWSAWSETPSNTIMFDNDKEYVVKGMYIVNSCYAYYCCAEANSMGRPLNQEGDYFKIIAHGVKADGEETTTELELCGFHNGQFSAITDWTWWDLSALGQVVSLYFTMDSSDKGDYGMNTPSYFAMDQLTVSEPVKYYVCGGFNGWNANEPLEITEEGATFDVVEDPEDVESKEFKILTAGENDWMWLGGEDANNVGYFEISEGMMTAGTEITLDNAGANFRLPGSGNYTITLAKEAKAPYEGVKIVVKKNNTTPTAVTDINSKTVAGVKYVNMAGQVSATPFEGVNVMVTTYTDGTSAASKVIK